MIVIVAIGIFLTILNLFEESDTFMLPSIFAFYLIGQYSERTFKKQNKVLVFRTFIVSLRKI